MRNSKSMFVVIAIALAPLVFAQQAGGPPQSVVFFSARDGHSNNQI
jgi:hypothetical protein